MRVYGKRAMLNRPGWHSTAAIVAELEDFDGYWRATLQITDCTRKISLELPSPTTENDDDFENAMYKLDTLVEAVRELQKAMRSVRRRRR